MTTKVELTQAEKILAKMMAHDDAIAVGVLPENQTPSYTVNGIRQGAILAVAKMFNLFPNMNAVDGVNMFTRLKNPVTVLYHVNQEPVYGIKEPVGDVVILVTGEETDKDIYEIHGYAFKKNLIQDPDTPGVYHVYHHVFNPIDKDLMFEGVMSNEWK